jgi:hypothetical protein
MVETMAAARRGELIAKDLVEKQAAFLLVALRQKILNLPSTYADDREAGPVWKGCPCHGVTPAYLRRSHITRNRILNGDHYLDICARMGSIFKVLWPRRFFNRIEICNIDKMRVVSYLHPLAPLLPNVSLLVGTHRA